MLDLISFHKIKLPQPASLMVSTWTPSLRTGEWGHGR